MIRRFSIPCMSVFLIFACSMIFADGDSRPPTTAEKDFSRSTLNALAKAIPPGPDGWEKTGGTAIEDLRAVYTDPGQPLRLEYNVEWQDSARKMASQAQFADEVMKLTQKPGFTDKDVADLTKKTEPRDVYAKVEIWANISSQGITEKVNPGQAVAGGLVYQSQGEYGNSGSWREGTTYIFLGNGWKMNTGAGTYVNFTPEKKAASSTVIQNMVVKIQADPARTGRIIQIMNWDLLKGLMK